MFHQQDAHALKLELAQHAGQRLLFLVAQAGGGFVQQQQGGVGAQRAGNLHQPLRAHGQVARLLMQVSAHADAFQLALGFAKQLLLFGAVGAQHGGQHTLAAPGVGAQGHVFQHRHVGDHLHVLKGAGHALAGDAARVQAADGLAAVHHFAAGGGQHARDQVERGRLARTVGPNQAHDLAGVNLETDVVHRHQAAKLHAGLAHIEHQRAGLGLVALGQGGRLLPVHRARALGQVAAHQRPQAVGQVLQHHHQRNAKHDHFVAAAGAHQLGQQHLQLVFQHADEASAHDGAPHMAHATHHRHEQVFNAHLQAEGRRVDGALKVRQQPARHRSQQRGQHKDRDLVAEGADAHGLGHLRAAFERPDGAARARVQQVQQTRSEGQQQHPGEHEEGAALADVEFADAQALDAQQAVVFAQRVQVAHEVIQRQAPGYGGQRQVVARHAQCDQAHQQRTAGGEAHAHEQREPGREAGVEREPGGGVGANAHKRGLAKRGQPAHTREQHQTQHGDAVHADVVELGDPEVGQGQYGDQRNGGAQDQQAHVLQVLHVSGPHRNACFSRTGRAGPEESG